MRLENIKRLLMETDLPIDKIALMTGFTSPIYMRVAFKKNLRITPAKYRATSRQHMFE
jgi:transcriptional regulator GlxA family with amidase domain